ncbi:hypothetical protein [Streptomyces sp. 11x1]|nr:hypothetical protein [Streptomyces sp. 11x1]WNZ11811.1 hypothetical protein P8T65_32515 [Streptomyces sp. 11x1]
MRVQTAAAATGVVFPVAAALVGASGVVAAPTARVAAWSTPQVAM